jgi:adenosine deaminase
MNEIIAEKAIAWHDRGVVGIDIAGPEASGFRASDYRDLFERARRFGLGITVHVGEAGPVEEVAEVVECLEPDRIGHGVKSAYDPRTMAMLRERGIVLEICPTSNLQTEVVSGWEEFRWIFEQFRANGVRYAISTDGPEMLRTYIRDELAMLGRLGILSYEEQVRAAETSLEASFVPRAEAKRPAATPATRHEVEREEA